MYTEQTYGFTPTTQSPHATLLRWALWHSCLVSNTGKVTFTQIVEDLEASVSFRGCCHFSQEMRTLFFFFWLCKKSESRNSVWVALPFQHHNESPSCLRELYQESPKSSPLNSTGWFKNRVQGVPLSGELSHCPYLAASSTSLLGYTSKHFIFVKCSA